MIFKASTIGEEAYKVRRHLTEWHKKFTTHLPVLFSSLSERRWELSSEKED